VVVLVFLRLVLKDLFLVQQQLQEIQGIQQNLFDLERNYSKMKAK